MRSLERECAIVGGGLAGGLAGLLLAQAGRAPLLLEKEKTAHHKVCGEFLSPEAVSYLRGAGIDPVGLGAVPIHMLRLSVGRRVVETRLPFTALSVSRCVLDEALLQRAEEEGCTVRRGVAVEKMAAREDGWAMELSSAETVTARSVFQATGKHDLRGWARGRGVQGNLVGFKLHWRLGRAQTAELREAMELYLFPGGYGGISLVEREVATLCLVVRKPELRKMGGWPGLLDRLRAGNGRVRYLLEGAEPLWERPLAVSSIPYGHLGAGHLRAARGEAGFWPLGDQVAVIPSFTGDGMSIALHSAAMATGMFLRGATEAEYEGALVRQLRRGMLLATGLSLACVQSLPQLAAPLALRVFPQAMAWVAAATRIPAAALGAYSRVS